MILFTVLSLLFSPVHHETHLQISFPNHRHLNLADYRNRNFSQKVEYRGQHYHVFIRSTDTGQMPLRIQMHRDTRYIDGLSPALQRVVAALLRDTRYIDQYLEKVSTLLGDRITYSEREQPQDADSVLLRKNANCVGYARLCQVLLEAVKIRSRMVEGFYLNSSPRPDILIPQSHLWLEIFVEAEMSVFYDPQYQNFTENYILLHDETDFTRIRKFEVKILKKTSKLIN